LLVFILVFKAKWEPKNDFSMGISGLKGELCSQKWQADDLIKMVWVNAHIIAGSNEV